MPKLKSYEWEYNQTLTRANGLVRYYRNRVDESGGGDTWQTGLTIATEFFKLFESGEQNPLKFDSLVQAAKDFEGEGSASYDLLWCISGWQKILQTEEQLQSDEED